MSVPVFEAPVSVFRGSTDVMPEETVLLSAMLTRIHDGTYQKPVTALRQCLATKGKAAYDRAKKRSIGFTPAGVFERRANAKLTTPSGLLNFDFDHVPALPDAKARLAADPCVVYAFISPSGDGLKVAVWAEGIVNDLTYKNAWGSVLAYLERTYPDLAVTNDAHCKDIARLCYVSHDPDAYWNPDPQQFAVPPPQAPAPKPKRTPARILGLPGDRWERYGRQAIETAQAMIDASVPPSPTTPGTRHATRLKAARLLGGYVAGHILTSAEAREALRTAVADNTDDMARSMKTIDDGLAYGLMHPITLEQLEAERLDWLKTHRASLGGHRPAVPDMTGTTPAGTPWQPPPVDPDDFLTDNYNARALVKTHRQDVRHCYVWDAWLVWNENHWQRDTSGAVMQFAKQTIKGMARQVAALDTDQARLLLTHIKSSLSTARLKAMLVQAQDEPGIPVQPGDLDRDPWLLNCQNGTVDLRTGERHAHRKEDLITRCLDIPYDENAPCPHWLTFLWRIMGGSQSTDESDMGVGELAQRAQADHEAREMIDFLQRAIGYSLTGSTREQCLFILYGITKTGKSTFLAVLRALLGPYGTQADMETFMHKTRPEVRNDLADLAGKRLVCAVESQEGRRLNENLIKQLTGGVDEIKARFLFEEHFTFKPQFKAFIGTNHKPIIRDTDNAIWERIRLIPFEVQIPLEERDKTLDETLLKELPGILAWAVKGCLAWQKSRDLKAPERVTAATTKYQEEMDRVGRFLAEECQLGTAATGSPYTTTFRVLHRGYQQWSGDMALSASKFKEVLEKKGYQHTRLGAGMAWLGIGLPGSYSENEDK